MRDCSPYQNQPKKFYFSYFFRLSKFNRNTQKSIIELQSIVTFLNYFFLLFSVSAVPKLILIKGHLRFFISDKQNDRNHGHRETTFFLKATMFESHAVPLVLTFSVPENCKTSLKHVQMNLVNLTAIGLIVSLQKIP